MPAYSNTMYWTGIKTWAKVDHFIVINEATNHWKNSCVFHSFIVSHGAQYCKPNTKREQSKQTTMAAYGQMLLCMEVSSLNRKQFLTPGVRLFAWQEFLPQLFL